VAPFGADSFFRLPPALLFAYYTDLTFFYANCAGPVQAELPCGGYGL
jgi:hypothetical protein